MEDVTTWPLLRVTLPPGVDEDQAAGLTQAAADEGALGGQTGAGQLLLYLPREGAPAIALRVRAALEAEAVRLGCGALEVAGETLPDAPWATAWKADFVALPVGERLLVRPDWEYGTAIRADWQTREVIYIRPGGGFGTARHETTRLALELLEKWVRSGTRVFDFGAGSGILAIAAARLGAERVVAVEHDPEAIINARVNIELNGLQERIELLTADAPPPAGEPFNLIVCNMLPHEARPHFAVLAGLLAGANPQAPRLSTGPEPNSSLIYSGLLADQKEEIESVLATHGLHPREWAEAAEWGAGVYGTGRA